MAHLGTMDSLLMTIIIWQLYLMISLVVLLLTQMKLLYLYLNGSPISNISFAERDIINHHHLLDKISSKFMKTFASKESVH